MRIVLLLTTLLTALMAHSNAPSAEFSAQHIKVVNVVAPEWPDFSNKDGTGLYWDVVKAVYEPAGIRVKHATVPWNRAMKMVTKYPVYNAIIGEYKDSEEPLRFPDYAIDVERLAVLYPVGKGIEWQQQATFSNRTVGWIKDYEIIPQDQRDFTLREFRDTADGVGLLMEGKLDMLIDEWDEIAMALQEAGVGIENFEMHDMPEGTDVYVAFADSDLSNYLIEVYNRRIPELVKEGKLQAIYQKWGVGEIPANVQTLIDQQ
ncbi:hypothetical protein CHH28_02300 [Bacterioplanes sanyensis]|uniref:Solute-binding protein family 3/N-terminal domain-containing protein n=1 Tax=Bacterioplanes sanyensis TaxID=1249553 RepID=A0A222FGE6_9GAMM|nr:transporter substrate-binding domain-containing protein [Bacterioplanes sanyensis]ASP37574.1 hypothetical protein CHH28_02300 [Bacterioplanes sanyensis]